MNKFEIKQKNYYSNFTKMKKIGAILAILLFTINTNAQEVKPAVKEKAKKESCCAKKESCDSKAMSTAEIKKCKAKCIAEKKTCHTTMAKSEEKKCCAKKA